MSSLSFPNISPIAFSLGFLEVKWYSLAYIFGAILAFLYIKLLNKYSKLIPNNTQKEFFDDLFFYSLLGVLLGGRLGYVIFYGLPYYLGNPLKILAIWEGGMSFHGGLIGVILAGYFIAKKYKVSILEITDIIAPAAPIGLFLGRIANFINIELYGKPTNLPWAVQFPNVPLPRHPSQIYEAILEGIVLFILLTILWRERKYLIVGILTGYGLVLYGFFRILSEVFREGEIYIFGIISMGQILSSFMILVGFMILARAKNQKPIPTFIKKKFHLKEDINKRKNNRYQSSSQANNYKIKSNKNEEKHNHPIIIFLTNIFSKKKINSTKKEDMTNNISKYQRNYLEKNNEKEENNLKKTRVNSRNGRRSSSKRKNTRNY